MSKRATLASVIILTVSLGLAMGCGGGGAGSGGEDSGDGAAGDAGKEVEVLDDTRSDTDQEDGLSDADAGVDVPLDVPPDMDVPPDEDVKPDGEVQPEEVAPAACDAPDACEPPLGCVIDEATGQGHCLPCEQGEDCLAPLGCVLNEETGVNECADCAEAAHCPQGQACRLKPEPSCGACRMADECREGEGCVLVVDEESGEEAFTCGECQQGTDCSGWLCLEADGGKHCVDCQEGPEGACATEAQYDDPLFVCKESGLCSPTACEEDQDCRAIKMLCGAEGLCVPCDGSEACALSDAYEPDATCVEINDVHAICVEDGCGVDADCPASLPICDGELHTCRACDQQAEGECEAALGVPAVCTDQGRCEPGDCYPAGATCGEDGDGNSLGDYVCADLGEEGFACQPCEAAADCVGALGLDHAICDAGACVAGCLSIDDCDVAGQICDSADHVCKGCEGNAGCAADYGGWLCIKDEGAETGLCQDKACNDEKPCEDDRICLDDSHGEAAHTCVDCIDELDLGVCAAEGTVCLDKTCTVCTALDADEAAKDQACVSAYGDGSGGAGDQFLCLPEGCTAGECRDQSGCVDEEATWICGTDHFCEACSANEITPEGQDQACKDAFTDLHICEDDDCSPGCVPDTLCPADATTCPGGQLCGADNRWAACAANADCAAALDGYLCVEGLCVVAACNDELPCAGGQVCHGGACVDCTEEDTSLCELTGEVCVANACKACSTIGSADEADQRCALDYGAGTICADQQCRVGDCHDLEEVNGLGQICTGYMWSACESDLQCKQALLETHWVCRPSQLGLGDVCVEGCRTGDEHKYDCSVDGQKMICDAASNECISCVDDDACKAHWGGLFRCDPVDGGGGETTCVEGCAPGGVNGDCPDGEVCELDNRCAGCNEDLIGDAKCRSYYDPEPRICIGGGCVAGECRESFDCVDEAKLYNGNVCVGNQCELCDASKPCPSGYVCSDSVCVLGECCEGAGCAPEVSCAEGNCDNHQCGGCVTPDDCVEKFGASDCLSASDDVCSANACEPPIIDGELNGKYTIKDGWCYIGADPTKASCYNRGHAAPGSDGDCLLCIPETQDGGKQREWTPGKLSGSGSENFQATHCYIDDQCVPAGTPAYDETASFEAADWLRRYECRWCDPEEGDRDSLFDWTSWPANPDDPPTDPSQHDKRRDCTHPMFGVFGDLDQATSPTYAGSTWGKCWQGECRGLSWTPWLPLGPSAAGGAFYEPGAAADAAPALFGVMGGGFGMAIPNPNPGCFGKEAPDGCEACPYLDGCGE